MKELIKNCTLIFDGIPDSEINSECRTYTKFFTVHVLFWKTFWCPLVSWVRFPVEHGDLGVQIITRLPSKFPVETNGQVLETSFQYLIFGSKKFDFNGNIYILVHTVPSCN